HVGWSQLRLECWDIKAAMMEVDCTPAPWAQIQSAISLRSFQQAETCKDLISQRARIYDLVVDSVKVAGHKVLSDICHSRRGRGISPAAGVLHLHSSPHLRLHHRLSSS